MQFAAAAATAADEAEADAQQSLRGKRTAAPAGINGSQLRAVSQGIKGALTQNAARLRAQEQSARRQARAAAVAVALPAVQGPVSPLVDLTGDAD